MIGMGRSTLNARKRDQARGARPGPAAATNLRGRGSQTVVPKFIVSRSVPDYGSPRSRISARAGFVP
jgi:hypothetical protein